MHHVLISYASHEPGRRGFMNETKIEEANSERKEFSRQCTENLTTAERLRNSAYSSPFGEEVKRASPAGDIADSIAAGTISQIAYAGMFAKSIVCILITALACIPYAMYTVPPPPPIIPHCLTVSDNCEVHLFAS